jgi:hypothetical protein
LPPCRTSRNHLTLQFRIVSPITRVIQPLGRGRISSGGIHFRRGDSLTWMKDADRLDDALF